MMMGMVTACYLLSAATEAPKCCRSVGDWVYWNQTPGKAGGQIAEIA